MFVFDQICFWVVAYLTTLRIEVSSLVLENKNIVNGDWSDSKIKASNKGSL